MKFFPPSALFATLFLASSLSPAFSASYTWTPTAAGTTYDWPTTAQNNWGTGVAGLFPNAAGDVANVNNDIVGNQKINLNGPRTIGILNLGDSSGSNTFELASGSSGTLIFDSGLVGTPAQINLANAGIVTNAITAPILLTSNLTVNMGGIDAANAQRISFSAGIAATGKNLTFTGGINVSGASGISITGANNLIGDANTVITNNSHGAMVISGIQSNFFGKIVLNGKASGSNVTTLATSSNGSVLNASEIVINGFLSGGVIQNGGAMQVGQGSSLAANPGQRLTQNTITFNGGTLLAGGQKLDAPVVNRTVSDTVSSFKLNSGYSFLRLESFTDNGGSKRVLNVGTLNRTTGASLLVIGSQFNNPSATNATTWTVGNGSSLLLGSSGTAGQTNIAIIPWMVADNSNLFASSGNSFATYDANGIRALNTSTEYATTLTAGAAHNVSIGNVAIANPDTSLSVNSLRYSASSATNIGLGKTLNVVSGGVIFVSNNGIIGAAGNTAAGTLGFGSAEGVIWANGANLNSVGSSISGSGGLTKAGTGTLTLTGVNTYSGLTYVSAGTLIVGDGTNISNLGSTGNVGVANGAVLSLLNGNAIADTATLTLENFGLVNGLVSIATGVNETVGALYLGDTLYGAGTYGAVGSGAGFQNNQWFSGSGIITVVPEPSTVALAGLGLTILLSRFRLPLRGA